jgi:redox-sensitive bicupin YhaK (pirin superfamily)
MEPGFLHYGANDLPDLDLDGVNVRVIMGDAYEHSSPVKEYSPTLYLECRLPQGARLDLPDSYEEIGAYVVSGSIEIDGDSYTSGSLAVAENHTRVRLVATEDSRVMVLGGAPLGKRYIWWNFVAGSKQRIEQAKRDWQQGRFGNVPGDDEFIPLPRP